jgi:hypothetical protein
VLDAARVSENAAWGWVVCAGVTVGREAADSGKGQRRRRGGGSGRKGARECVGFVSLIPFFFSLLFS